MIVAADDPGLSGAATTLLHLHPGGFALQGDRYERIAGEYAQSYLNRALESGPREKVSVMLAKNLGLMGTFGNAAKLAFWADAAALPTKLVADVLPIMQNDLGATRVYPLRIDAELFQLQITLSKASYFNTTYGREEARKRILEERQLDSLLPTATDLSGFLDALIFLDPFAFALPLHRVGSALYFIAKNVWAFPIELRRNFFETAASELDPLGESQTMVVHREGEFGARLAGQFLSLSVVAVNRVVSWSFHPASFPDANGEKDHWRTLKILSLLRLMFADVLSINYSTSTHIKSRLAFQFLDKLASLLADVSPLFVNEGHKQQRDAKAFAYLLSPAAFNRVRSIIRFHAKPFGSDLAQWILKTHYRVEAELDQALAECFDRADEKISEGDRDKYFRVLRNLAHGTLLDRQQIEAVFLRVNPRLPNELSYWPWALLLAFSLAPEHFLWMEGR